MAATSGSVPEPGRPPDAARKLGRDPAGDNGNDNRADDVNYNNAERGGGGFLDTRRLLRDAGGCGGGGLDGVKVVSKAESWRKVFFSKKSPVKSIKDKTSIKKDMNLNEPSIVTVSATVDRNCVRAKSRNSFHQDVEEALSSLLWQPYEYQNKQRSSSLGSSSSCSSLSSSGLESSAAAASAAAAPNNGTDRRRSGNAADLHLLVNNLQANLLGQPGVPRRSRGPAERRAEARPPLGLASSAEDRAEDGVPFPARHLRQPSSSVVGFLCDEYRGGAMRVEVPPQVPVSAAPTQGGNAGGVAVHGLMQGRLPPPPRGGPNNLSSVNVVGLPSTHPRQASVPNAAGNRGGNMMVPNHSRNTSEPFRGGNGYIQVPNHPRNGSEPVTTPYRPPTSINNANIVSIMNHQRFNNNQQQQQGGSALTHMRNTSVPYQQQQLQQQQQQHHGMGIPVRSNDGQSDTPENQFLKRLAHPQFAQTTEQRSSRVPLNVSNINVNYYRAVPVNVVSAVPTIQCMNSTSDANNISNVNIVQAMPVGTPHTLPVPPATSATTGYISNTSFTNTLLPSLSNGTTSTNTCTEVIVHSSHEPVQVIASPQRAPPEVRTRTFTSTEAQTDDVAADGTNTREQRRRERRERRHQRRLNNHRHNPGTADPTGNNNNNNTATQTAEQRLPDLLNNTLPPPYSPNGGQLLPPPAMVQPPPPPVVPGNLIVPPGTIVQSMVPNSIVPSGLIANAMVPFHPQVVTGQVPLVQAAGPVPVPSPTGFRFPFPAGGFRRSRYSEEPPKSCCGLLAWRPGSLRWFIALIALVAVCCVLVGTALGAMRPSGRDHLTVSLLMIGVGIILVTVSGVAWRLTSHDSSTCRSMLGLGSTESVEVCPRRFVPRLPPSYGRPHHPYAAMMYPEFQYRPPPPSYQASMQEYRLRLLLLDRGNTPQIQAGIQNAVSPPPTYRSHSGSLLRAPLSNRRDLSQSEYSCPPSYRSQTSSSRPGTIIQNNSIIHSREQSLSLSESNNGGSVVNVVNILTSNGEDDITLDSLKLEPDNEINVPKVSLKGSTGDLDGSKDGNLVTIVQTNDQSPVIVTVSGSSHQHDGSCNTVQITEIPSEMEILAHL